MTPDVKGAKIESVYEDFANMGKIFGKENRASEIISAMKAKIDPIAVRTKALLPLDPDSGYIRYTGFVHP